MTSRFGTWNDVVGLPPLADTIPDQGYPAPGDTLGTLETPQLDSAADRLSGRQLCGADDLVNYACWRGACQIGHGHEQQ